MARGIGGAPLAFGCRQLACRCRLSPRGADVVVLQSLWNALGGLLDRPLGRDLPLDGEYGPETAAATAALQRHFGLFADGVVGPSTCFVLGHGAGAHATYGGPPLGSRPLRQGDSGGDVYVLQNRLAVLGGLLRPADGTADAVTLRALASFQAEQGLPAGPLDAPTANALIVRSLAGGRAVWSGRNGLDVAWVQRRLQRGGGYAGPVDGLCGPETASAVRAFQGRCHLVSDGVVGPDTFAALGTAGNAN